MEHLARALDNAILPAMKTKSRMSSAGPVGPSDERACTGEVPGGAASPAGFLAGAPGQGPLKFQMLMAVCQAAIFPRTTPKKGRPARRLACVAGQGWLCHPPRFPC